MARGLNKVQIIGRLGREPELRYTQQGTAMAHFSVAVNRTRQTGSGNPVEETEWFRIVAWDKLAEIAAEYLAKGQLVYVEGRLHSHTFTDQANVTRTSIEIVASEILMLGGTSRQATSSEQPAALEEVPF